jgi:hypothetical protein
VGYIVRLCLKQGKRKEKEKKDRRGEEKRKKRGEGKRREEI